MLELNKMIKELCIRKGGRKKKVYPSTIQVEGKVADLLSGKLIHSKYGDPGSPMITILIGTTKILNVLVDLGAAINVMITEMLKKLALLGMHPTITVLQMDDQSIAKLEEIIEDIHITVESWNYLVDFLILKPRAQSGYPIILGRPWLATAAAFINCRFGDMTILDGQNSKIISLYPLAQPTLEYQGQLWVDEPELDEPQSLAVLSTITIKEHIEELEEMLSSPKNEEAPTTLQVGESSGCNLQKVIFNLSPRYQSNFLSIFKCSLTHIVPKGEAFRDITKLYHSLFPHACPLNSLV